MQIINIDKKNAHRPLGNYLKKELNMPVGLIHKLLRQNKIKLNGKKPDLGWILPLDSELKIFTDLSKKDQPSFKLPEAFYQKNLHIIYDHKDFFVLNKKPGMATQPSKHIPLEKTVDGLAHYYGQKHHFRPYLVHRLDRDTSGAMIVAKNTSARDFFHDLFKKRLVKKTYAALAKGHLKNRADKITTPVTDNSGQKISAETNYYVIQTFKDVTLLEAKPTTGRFHQIRQHLKSLGHPIVQDETYGDFNFNKKFQKKYGLKRQFLHAVSLEFIYQNKPLMIEVPLADDLKNTLNKLRN